jgi:hypothetical protein
MPSSSSSHVSGVLRTQYASVVCSVIKRGLLKESMFDVLGHALLFEFYVR